MMLLQALTTFRLAGHAFSPRDVFECLDLDIAQALLDRKLCERITNGNPKITLISAVSSWSQPDPSELPMAPNLIRNGGARP
jgi:hypothetical protein